MKSALVEEALIFFFCPELIQRIAFGAFAGMVPNIAIYRAIKT